MKLEPTVVVAVIACIGSLVSIFLTNRYAARSARAALDSAERSKQSQVDSEAFKRARESYDAAIAEQEARIGRLRAQLEEDREEHRIEIEQVNRRVESLRDWSRGLLRAARAAGVVHPEPPMWLGGSDTDPGLPRVNPDPTP